MARSRGLTPASRYAAPGGSLMNDALPSTYVLGYPMPPLRGLGELRERVSFAGGPGYAAPPSFSSSVLQFPDR